MLRLVVLTPVNEVKMGAWPLGWNVCKVIYNVSTMYNLKSMSINAKGQ